GRHHCPQPRGPDCQLLAETSLGDQENRNTSQRGKEAVDTEQYQCRSVRINPEQFENSGNEKWIERRLPGCRSRGLAERIAETLALREGASNATHFPAKAEVVVE